MLGSLLTTSSVSFQTVSDLHLEVNRQYPSYDIPVCAKHLILAGDVGRLADYDDYRNFLQKQTVYHGSFAAGLEKARRLEQEPSLNGWLIFLHQGRYDVPESNVTVLGCTLWSKVPLIVHLKIKDFQKIDGWTVDDHNARHDSDLAWLLGEIQSIQDENKNVKRGVRKQLILVVTHHAPLLRGTSSPEHAQNAWRFAFGTDILPQVSDGLKTWVFEYTHYTTDFKEGRVRVVSNQRGYVLPWTDTKKTKDRFDVKKVIRIS